MRVPRTFVFVDISGFTNYTTNNGDVAAGALLANWRRVTRDLASETGVRIAKSGRRFRIAQAIVWNLLDEHGARCGQAAMFEHWEFL